MVVHDEPFPPILQQAGVPEVAEVAGGLGLGDPKELLNLAGAEMPVTEEERHDSDAGLVGEGFERGRELFHTILPKSGTGEYTRLSG